ncbi:hypothetical protein GCM10010149_45750 [Nonomuraea roseoviolacea subsp. roseoviolacea]
MTAGQEAVRPWLTAGRAGVVIMRPCSRDEMSSAIRLSYDQIYGFRHPPFTGCSPAATRQAFLYFEMNVQIV